MSDTLEMRKSKPDITEFVDAQEQHRKTPSTFWAPSELELQALRVGDLVKVCLNDERFWVKLTAVTGLNLRGTVDNKLIIQPEDGPDYGDSIEFERRHIFDIE